MIAQTETSGVLTGFGHGPTRLGFRNGDVGTHTSRTMMLSELRAIFDAVPASASAAQYCDSIVESNVTGKKTLSTRRLTAQRISEMYALDPKVPIFQLFRTFWDADRAGQPLLAALCACARDPLLRMTSAVLFAFQEGEVVPTESFDDGIHSVVGERFKPAVRNKIARNASSSWTQSGHLKGRAKKLRSHPVATAGTTAFAAALAYLSGLRGATLLDSTWLRLLDVSADRSRLLLSDAARQGWLTFRTVGHVHEISFPTQLIPADWLKGADE